MSDSIKDAVATLAILFLVGFGLALAGVTWAGCALPPGAPQGACQRAGECGVGAGGQDACTGRLEGALATMGEQEAVECEEELAGCASAPGCPEFGACMFRLAHACPGDG